MTTVEEKLHACSTEQLMSIENQLSLFKSMDKEEIEEYRQAVNKELNDRDVFTLEDAITRDDFLAILSTELWENDEDGKEKTEDNHHP